MLTSCNNDLVNEHEQESKDEKVELTFKVNVPEASAASRTFDTPEIENLYLIVFDENGYFSEKCEAKATNGWSAVIDKETEFTVTLTASASKRTIHFIASYNGGDQLAFGSESDVVGSMTHSGDADAYWQRMTYTGGIDEKTDLGTIPLLRNHAKITVTENLDNFELESFTVVNIPTKGYVAPYNKNTYTFAEFADIDATNGTYTLKDYTNITSGSTGYEGYVPTTTGDLNTAIDNEDNWKDADGAFYLYERSFETTDHTFLIVKGKYNGSNTSTYYKVDLVYTDTGNNKVQYYHLLRNFHYSVTITEVTGAGQESAEAAYNMTGSHNNLSASTDTESLTNISDGDSQLYVSYTKEVIVSSSPITLLYKYIPNIENKTVNNGAITTSNIVCTTPGDVINSYTLATTNEVDENNNDTGWRAITIAPNEPDADEVKTQTLTIQVGSLSRTVTYYLCQPYAMTVNCSQTTVAAAIQQPVTVSITIPSNLSEFLFPLTFYIEAEERTLYPDASKNQLPVETDIPSLFDGKATFGYTKEITWEDYIGSTSKTFECHFLTNTANNASRIKVYNKYFSTSAYETSFSN